MDEDEKIRHEIEKSILGRMTERIAQALARRDCEQTGMEVPGPDHELWTAWRGGAEAAVEEMKRELMAFIEYENTITWGTTCVSCARILDSAYAETIRREMGELTLKEIAEWAHTTRYGHAAGEVLPILEKGAQRLEKTMKGEGSEALAGDQD